MKKFFRYSLKIILLLIIVAVLFLAAGFFAIRFGWTNVPGGEDINSKIYNSLAKKEAATTWQKIINLPKNLSVFGENENLNWCRLGVAAKYSPYDASGMFKAYKSAHSEELLIHMLLALQLRKGATSNFANDLKNCTNEPGEWNEKKLDSFLAVTNNSSAYTWQNSEYWSVIKEAIIKDEPAIVNAAQQTGIQPRLLVSVAIVEQLRLYYTQREFYEKLFKPLKILANANKMAWGVMSIKEAMAIETENYLHDSTSVFYPGKDYEKLLDYNNNLDIAKERYSRLTNEKNHYYSYLYGSLIIKELETQWKKAGYDIKYRPEIVATLFNIGFKHSEPKAEPVVGGSTLDINGEKYFFGSLAFEFYYSGELVKEFPFK